MSGGSGGPIIISFKMAGETMKAGFCTAKVKVWHVLAATHVLAFVLGKVF